MTEAGDQPRIVSAPPLRNREETATPHYMRLGSIAFSADGVAEMDRHVRVAFIPRDELRSLTLAYAAGAEQPIVVLVIAAVVLAVSLYPIAEVVNWLIEGGVLQGEVVWLCALFPLAPWLLHLALKRRFILVARQQRGRRKLIFGSEAEAAAIEPFLSDVASRFGYTVHVADSAKQRLSSLPLLGSEQRS